MLLLTVVLPLTEPVNVLYEYAPTKNEMPPPCEFAPLEEEDEVLDADVDELQEVILLLEMVHLLLLTEVLPFTEPSDKKNV